MTCQNCGDPLQTDDPRKKFCSNACRKAHKALQSKEQAYQNLLEYHRYRAKDHPEWFGDPQQCYFVRGLRSDRDFVHIRFFADETKLLRETTLCEILDGTRRFPVPGRDPVTCPTCKRLFNDLFPGKKAFYHSKRSLE